MQECGETGMKKPWALVTGASDGIGVEFAKLLAARGYNLVLVARREATLQEVAARMTADYAIESRVVPCDLAVPGAARDLHRSVAELGIGVDFLVNNAGLLRNGFFHEIELQGQEDMIQVNVSALMSLTHLYANDMLVRGGGHILNVASTAAFLGIPQQNVYAATKAFVLPFSIALHDEMRARGGQVVVTALCPGYTDTKMLDNPEQGPKLEVPKASVLEPGFVAEQGIEGCLAGRAMVIPGLANRLAMPLLQALPRTWVTRAVGMFYRKAQS